MRFHQFLNIYKTLCKTLVVFSCLCLLSGCENQNNQQISLQKNPKKDTNSISKNPNKIVIYQVLPRLFGNQNTTKKPWGTIEDNGVGKFEDFNDTALQAIKQLGVTHIWYTGVLHHAVIRDYTKYGIENDDPDVVKGRAGSPYAVKDYYNVDPDLALNPVNRLQQFKQLIKRTHQHGMKVIIDIVPNHVARNYQSISAPKGVRDFGADDNKSVVYDKNNNFYYIVGEEFKVPEGLKNHPPLGGEKNPLIDNYFFEKPAKWTGNNSRLSQPDINDWYETVKINFGISPDGIKDFPELPKEYANKSYADHYLFWKDKEVPSSWIKFRDIALYWLDFGVDGFRYDMAEMVPVEFWSYFNSAIKHKNPDAYLVAEIYNPSVYRDYIHIGKMDAIYDKVDLYDTLKSVMQNKQDTSKLVSIQNGLSDIENHILHFLENHDEQRIASKDFVGNAEIAKPAMVVSTLVNSGPIMLYFAQELGEPGDGDAGFGDPTRTTIFDYWGIPSLQRWINQGKFDGAKLSDKEKSIRDFYSRLLNFAATSEAVSGHYFELQTANRNTQNYNGRLFSFARWNNNQAILVISNFDDQQKQEFELSVPTELIKKWGLDDGNYSLKEKLYDRVKNQIRVKDGAGFINVKLQPLESFVFSLEFKEGSLK